MCDLKKKKAFYFFIYFLLIQIVIEFVEASGYIEQLSLSSPAICLLILSCNPPPFGMCLAVESDL